jgi:PucR C-terminal helix-turn-helix domain
MGRAPARARAELVARLRERRPEIEQAVLTRVHSISDPATVSDPTYAEGLRRAVSAAIEHGLTGLEHGERGAPAAPPELLAQARLAARGGVSLDTVLRRYFAGYALLGDFLVEEAEREPSLQGQELKHLLRAQSTILDGLLAAVSEEHAREEERHFESSAQRRAECVERLLDGELVDTSGLAYDFEAHHLGLLAFGPNAAEWARDLAATIDCRSLLIPRGEGTVWAWLGSSRSLDPDALPCPRGDELPPGLCVAFGEPGEGLAGWRFTHRQAAAALPVAQRGSEPLVRYRDVALLASVIKDELLVSSLRKIYLEPLARQRDGGKAARETLRAYFDADRNVASAAASLGVSRQAANSRLRTIESVLGRPLSDCVLELEMALRIELMEPHHS